METEQQQRLLIRQLDYIRELENSNEELYDDIYNYRKIIKRLISDLEKGDNLECKNVYNRCINTRTYRSFHWESSDED
jgi:hypothetical protein